ncbi:MAG: hypothetical protein M3R17_20075 [Bacteroidota bacterium]|nr:hypothetical protein [Bacteroidota bacterium]
MKPFRFLKSFLSFTILTSCDSAPRTNVDSANTTALEKSIDRKKINQSPKQNWFTTTCHTLCDESKGILLDMNKYKQHGKYHPYNLTEFITKDSAIISFDFITDCCMTFAGAAEIKNDVLNLHYGPDNDSMRICDCYCDYRMTYRIDKKGREWKTKKITHGR